MPSIVWPWDLEARLASIEAIVSRIDRTLRRVASEMETTVMPTIQDIEKKVGEVGDTEDSVIALLDQIHQMLKDAQASGDPAAVQRVLDQLQSQKDALAAAVVRNTDAG